MMSRHPRQPATLILALAVLLGLGYVSFSKGARSYYSLQQATLEQLERAVAAPQPQPQAWWLYGQRLSEHGRHRHAAAAYARFLETTPYHREGRFRCGLALAQAGDADAFFAFARDLAYTEPKLAVDLLDRPESRPHLAQPRFQALAQDARLHAMD